LFGYLALRDGPREEQVAPWFGWSFRRRTTAAATTVAVIAGCAALGPLVSWVLATTLLLITALGIWVVWLAWRA
jgi:hypothetical protein